MARNCASRLVSCRTAGEPLSPRSRPGSYPATDDAILVGDYAYALAVETIARLDEPRFVGVASRMIRDGAGEISRGGAVSISLWRPHLAQLLGIISGEDENRSKERIRNAIEEVKSAGG